MKEVDIVSKIVNREGGTFVPSSKGTQSIDLSDYLLKSIWDKVFELRTDSQGTEYIFGKLPMVTQYGITMYSGDGVDIPSLASGLPFDGRTIWYNPDTQQIEVIGGGSGGGGTADSVAWANITGKPTWIGSSKPSYSYSEIKGAISTTELQNYLTSNSYLNVTSGDNRYLQLSGGTLSSDSRSPLTLKSGSSENHSLLLFNRGNDYWGSIGFNAANSLIFKDTNGANYTIWHSGNDGSGSGLDADLLDGKQPSELNVASATKLQTAKTIWGQGFDGTGNVSGALSDVTGITFKNDYYGLVIDEFGNFSFKKPYSTTAVDWSFKDSSGNKLVIINNNGNVGVGTPNPQQKIDVVGKAYVRDGILMSRSSDNSDAFFIGKEDTASQNLQILNSSGSGKIVFRTNRNSSIVDHFVLQQGSTALYDNLTINGYVKANYYDVSTTRQTSLTNSYTLGCGMYGSSIQHSVSDGYTLPALMWGAKSPNGNSSQFSIMSYHPPGATGYLIIGVAKNGTRTAFIEVQGDGVIQAGGDFLASGGITMYSDQRKKTILNHVELSLKDIANAPLIEHYYNSDDKKTTHVGSIAQYWASMNDWFCKLDSEGYYTMEIQNCALASAISIARELDRYETKTDKAIKKLKKRICELEEEVERLKRA